MDIPTTPNLDLTVVDDHLSRWSHPEHRRRGWHNLHTIARYASSFRAPRVMRLEKSMDLAIASRKSVRAVTSLPWFSAMVVTQGSRLLFERYAHDFGPERPHSIQSVTKTLVNLIMGMLVEEGVVDLSQTIGHYIPEIGSGYSTATVQQVLNMDVANDYSEDFADLQATYFRHEEAMGWRLPRDPGREQTQHTFLAAIESSGSRNRSGYCDYKDANTDLLGWVAERASGRPLRSFLADIVDAAGLEHTFHITTDREGVPTLSGGACMTARDLARYFSLFVRRGRGVSGQQVGSAAFIDETLVRGIPLPPPNEHMRYSNHLRVLGRSVMHSGWGGQYVCANLDTGMVGVLLSVIEDAYAQDRNYVASLRSMLYSIVNEEPERQ